MSAIRSTSSEIVTVCHCGATSIYKYEELTIGQHEVILPKCSVCNLCRITLCAVPSDESWVELEEDILKRYLLGQVIHYRALKKLAPPMKGQTHEGLLKIAEQERLHEYVDGSIEVYEAPLHPAIEAARQYYTATGMCFPLQATEELSSPSKDVSDTIRSRLFK